MEKMKIYCPHCGRKVMEYDGKSQINPMARCRKCNKAVVYDIESQETLIKPLPERKTSSGMTFY